jgi:simple sugar transport system ATP-binding protein
MEVRDISKSFGSVQALKKASLKLRKSHVTALVGDNGAGKSTLVKVMSGVFQPDSGHMLIAGQPVTFRDPLAARARGIHTVFQDLALVEPLSATENMFLGSELRTEICHLPIPWINKRTMAREARRALDRLGITTLQDINTPVESLSGGQRQSLAVARAVREQAHVVMLDEPTASLGVTEARHVLALMDSLRAAGTAVLVISHNLREIFSVTDAIVVLRFGRVVANLPTAHTDQEEVIAAMLGRGSWADAAGDAA